MDRQIIIGSISDTREDQVLLAHVWDRLAAGQKRNIPAFSAFLSGREQMLVEQMCRRGGLEQPQFYGGFPQAERRVAVYVPDYYDPESFLAGVDGPVAALRVAYSDYDTLSHRDYLGSLMGQGIKREILGDLLPGEGHCDVLVLREMADYLASQLTQVGRVRVRASRIHLSELEIPEQKVKRIADTVASLRLDSILASGFSQGRSKSASSITAGRVEVNHLPIVKPDYLVSEGDVISLRGGGKMRVAQVGGRTKKDRISVVLERFL